MDIEATRSICLSLKGTSEDIKWGNDLCFSVLGKMFCVAGLDAPLKIAFKVPDDHFEEMCEMDGIVPAPYMARAKWILVTQPTVFSEQEWRLYLTTSYKLVLMKIPKKMQKQAGLL